MPPPRLFDQPFTVEGLGATMWYVYMHGIFGDAADAPAGTENGATATARVLLVCCVLVMLVVMMNFLIAIMSDSYDKAGTHTLFEAFQTFVALEEPVRPAIRTGAGECRGGQERDETGVGLRGPFSIPFPCVFPTFLLVFHLRCHRRRWRTSCGSAPNSPRWAVRDSYALPRLFIRS